jgi:hypothetical protein
MITLKTRQDIAHAALLTRAAYERSARPDFNDPHIADALTRARDAIDQALTDPALTPADVNHGAQA